MELQEKQQQLEEAMTKCESLQWTSEEQLARETAKMECKFETMRVEMIEIQGRLQNYTNKLENMVRRG